MTVPEKNEFPNRIEYYLRRFFERVGGALDFALRRPLNPQARTDLSALLPQIEQAIEAKLRREGARVIAPNLIELRYDYETYGQMTDARREYLQKELQASLYEYVVNHRYTTLDKLQVKLAFDVFTRKLTISATFPDEAAAVATKQALPGAGQVALPAAPANEQAKSCTLTLRAIDRQFFGTLHTQLHGNETRAGLGRSHDNPLCLNDSTVSSFHAAFTLTPNGTLWLTDLGSSNGTFVNDVRLGEGDKVIVRAGDKLRFGDIEIKLEVQ
ncbi:MAG: FHA domain-containing protein [Acidobacteria bacterium]|nr:FHA domain-containing protein [Acidobacteriota bacterium]